MSVVIALGTIPLAEYATPGTPELSQTLAPLVPHHNAILMSNHGVVTYGEDLFVAYMRMETVEHFAKIALVTHMLGKQQLLSQEELEKLAITASPSVLTTRPPACETCVFMIPMRSSITL